MSGASRAYLKLGRHCWAFIKRVLLVFLLGYCSVNQCSDNYNKVYLDKVTMSSVLTKRGKNGFLFCDATIKGEEKKNNTSVLEDVHLFFTDALFYVTVFSWCSFSNNMKNKLFPYH